MTVVLLTIVVGAPAAISARNLAAPDPASAPAATAASAAVTGAPLDGIERVVSPLGGSSVTGRGTVLLGPAPTAAFGAGATTTVAPTPTTTTAAPEPTTTLAPATTTLAPATTTTAVPTTSTVVPVEPGVPAGTWDAAVAGTSAGARTSEVVADGLHVGPGQAYAAISDAVAAAGAGATIVVHDNGDAYREFFSHDDGWIGKPLRFVAAPGERPVVSGADLVTDWTADADGWVHQYADDRFEFPLPVGGDIIPEQIMASAPHAGLLEQVRVDGVALEQVGALADLAPGRFFVDRDANRIHLADDPAGRVVEVAARRRALLLASGASGSSVEGLTITGFAARHADGRAMIVVDQADDVVFRDVIVSGSSATGLVAVGAERLLLDRVSMVDNGARGLAGDRLTDLVIRRSVFSANNTESFDYVNCGGGTYCVLAGAKLTRSVGVEVSFSDFSQNRATGFWCDLECRDLVFVANHLVGNAKHGAYFEVSEGAVIEANILARNGDAGVKTSGSRDIRIAHNTFVDNTTHVNIGADFRPGTISFHDAAATHMRNIDVIANVFAEADRRIAVVDPVNQETAPNPWDRLGTVDANLYLLETSSDGSTFRFRLADGTFELDPDAVVSPAGVETGNAMAHFAGGGLADLRLVGDVAAIAAEPLSPAAAAFFPPLGQLPPGAPLS